MLRGKEGAGVSQEFVFLLQRGVLGLQGLVLGPLHRARLVSPGVRVLGLPRPHPIAQGPFLDTQIRGNNEVKGPGLELFGETTTT